MMGVALAALLTQLAAATASIGPDEEFVVELTGSPSQLPAVVCLAMDKEVKNLTKPREEVLGKPDRTLGQVDRWRFDHRLGKERSQENAYAQARSLLLLAPDASVLFADEDICAPRVALAAKDLHLWCMPNPRAGDRSQGVAFIDTQLSSDAHSVNFNVDGNLVTIDVRRAGKPQAGMFSVALTGGHYRETPRRTVVGHRAQLRLDPWCHTREVDPAGLGPRQSPSDSITLKYAMSGTATPLRKSPPGDWARAAIKLALPVVSDGVGSTLTLTRGTSSLRSEWQSAAPPEPLPPLKAETIAVTWQVPCEYAGNGCPDLKLLDFPISAGGTDPHGSVCSYEVGQENTPFPLPAKAVLTGNRQQWPVTLFHANQRLTDYVPADERQFTVEMPWATRAQREDDRVEYVELIGPRGTKNLLKPLARQPVRLASASCDDQVAYRFSGNREFEWDTVKIAHGRLRLPTPDRTATKAALGLLVGGGFSTTWSPDWRPYAMAELALHVRPARWQESGSWLVRAFRYPDYDFSVTYLLAPKAYRPLHAEDNLGDTSTKAVAYNRILLSAIATVPAGPVHLGGGFGVGLGYAMFSRDGERVGGMRAFLAPALRIRYDVNKRLALTLTARAIWPDSLYTHYSPDSFRGTAERSSQADAWRFFPDLGLQGWL